VGGTENHVHIQLSLPATVPLAKAAQLMKGASSRWMNETHTKGFSWQEGYGAFTLGVSQKPRTIDYIKRQAEHHQKRSFEEEFVAFLKKTRDQLRSQMRVGIVSGVPPGRDSFCHSTLR